MDPLIVRLTKFKTKSGSSPKTFQNHETSHNYFRKDRKDMSKTLGASLDGDECAAFWFYPDMFNPFLHDMHLPETFVGSLVCFPILKSLLPQKAPYVITLNGPPYDPLCPQRNAEENLSIGIPSRKPNMEVENEPWNILEHLILNKLEPLLCSHPERLSKDVQSHSHHRNTVSPLSANNRDQYEVRDIFVQQDIKNHGLLPTSSCGTTSSSTPTDQVTHHRHSRARHGGSVLNSADHPGHCFCAWMKHGWCQH